MDDKKKRDLHRFTNDARVFGNWPKLKFKTCHWSVQNEQLFFIRKVGVVLDTMVVDTYSDSEPVPVQTRESGNYSELSVL